MKVVGFLEAEPCKTGHVRQAQRGGARPRNTAGHGGGRMRRSEMATRRRRGGSIVFLIALSMVVLCGFCALGVDYGRAVVVRNQLQRACDAAALAGAKYLPDRPGVAKQAAVYYAWQNNKAVIDPDTIQFFNNNTRIRVRSTQNVGYTFAPVMKILNGDVSARATAGVQQRDVLPVGPIGITPSTYNNHKDGSPFVIEGIYGNESRLVTNDFVLFDLRGDTTSSKSPAHMQNQLEWGSTFNEPTLIGRTETILNASDSSQTGKFAAGMQSRFDAAAGSPWYDNGTRFAAIPPGSPRLMFFIVVPENHAVSSNEAPVLGFVPVYVQSMATGGDTRRLTVRMLPLTTGDGGQYVDALNNSDAESLRIVRLVD